MTQLQTYLTSFALMFALSACAGGGDTSPSGSGGTNTGGSGATNTGGSPATDTGGTGPSATGGRVGASGGAPGTGGSSGAGGHATTGGTTGSGGPVGASGGNLGTGGMAGMSSAGTGGMVSSSGVIITNDTFWKDTSGNPIYSQGGGEIRVGDTYYWYGVKYGGAVSYAADPSKGKNSDTSFQGITTYSSKDLANWKFETLSKPANAGGWFGRLGVVYHTATKKYVLVAQGGGGLYFATSDTPAGPFVYANVQTNLPGIANGSTGDQTMFQDDDGSAYLVSSSSSGRSKRYLSPLRASDFLAAESAMPVYSGGGREGNCMFKYAGTYYFCSSDLHGWNSSQTYCVSSSSVKGPWSTEFVLEGTDGDFSHVTQTGFFISVQGTQGAFIIFAGDRWSDFAGNGLGFNQWVPLSFTDKTPHFNSVTRWSIDAQAGTWGVAHGNNYVLNPSFEADRVAVSAPAGWKATGGHNVEDGRTGRWSWQLSASGSVEQKITGVPDGTYKFSVSAKGSGGMGQLYTMGCGGTDAKMSIAPTASFSAVTLGGVMIKGGECTVGLSAAGQLTVDDFVLSDD